MAISWPGHITDLGGIRNQFHHITDIVPTILEVTGIKAPDYVNGIKQKPIDGVSMAYTFDKANADAPSTHKTQYFEMVSNRGIYDDGWYANTTPPIPPWLLKPPTIPISEYKWELYNLKEDYSQANDLAAQMPDKLKEMQALFVQEANKYQVFPLDNQAFARAIEPRPSTLAGKTDFTYTGVNIGIPTDNAPSILDRSFTITAEVEVPEGGGNGMIVTEGGRWGGYGLYILNGMPVFDYNLLMLLQARWAGNQPPLAAGKHTIVFDFKYDGPGIAKGGTGVLKVDGQEVRTLAIPKTIPFVLPADESFDIGGDTRTGVNDQDYQVPFTFNGNIDKLSFHLGPVHLTREESQIIQYAQARARD
jgi:arylsulfatase